MKFLMTLFFSSLLLWSLSSSTPAQVIKIDHYQGFKVWVDCEKRGPIKFSFQISKDTNDLKRSNVFKIDERVPKTCQQTQTGSYNKIKDGWDVGHLVGANHLDHLPDGIIDSNFVTNVVPQEKHMNRWGAWRETEKITECYRDKGPLTIIGGVLWGSDTSNDYFVDSHGIATPDAFWKIIYSDNRIIAWIIPNSDEAKKRKVYGEYLRSVLEIEAIVGPLAEVPSNLKNIKDSSNWRLKGCQKGYNK